MTAIVRPTIRATARTASANSSRTVQVSRARIAMAIAAGPKAGKTEFSSRHGRPPQGGLLRKSVLIRDANDLVVSLVKLAVAPSPRTIPLRPAGRLIGGVLAKIHTQIWLFPWRRSGTRISGHWA